MRDHAPQTGRDSAQQFMQIEGGDHDIVHLQQEVQVVPFTREGQVLLVELVFQLADLFIGFLQRHPCLTLFGHVHDRTKVFSDFPQLVDDRVTHGVEVLD